MKDLKELIETYKENVTPYEKIDFSDSPELTKDDFDRGSFKYWKPRKKLISFRIDLDLLQWLKTTSEGSYQQRINSIIRQAMYKKTQQNE